MYSEFNNYGANATPVMMDCPEAPKQLEEMRPNGVIAELRNVDFGAFAQQAPIHSTPQNMHSVDGVHAVMQPNVHGALPQQLLQQNGDVRTEIKTEQNTSQPRPTVSAVKKKTKNKSKKKQNESIGWPDKDLCELFMRIESALPIEDKLAYKSRVDKLDWNAIAFNNYSSEDCKQIWCLVQKKMRRFRILREILTDAKEWIGQPKQAAKRMKVPNKIVDAPQQPLQIHQTPPPQQLPLQQFPQQLLQFLPPHQLPMPQQLPPPPQPPQQLPPKPPPLPPDATTHKEKRSHKRKHPDMPKPALSAYKLFYRDKKDTVIAQNPGLDPHAVGKLISQLFKTLPPEIKEGYEKQSQEMHREYESKLAAFNQAHPELAVIKEEKPPKTPKMSPSSSTKKLVTPFGLYYTDQLNSVAVSDKFGFRNTCKQKWRSLPDKEKMVWIEKALEEERKMLQQQQEQQQQQQPQENQQDTPEPSTSTPIKHCLTKKEQRIIERVSGKPTKPPGSAYAVFTRMMLMSEEIKCIHHRNRLSVISDQWKALSEEDKQLYKERSDAMTEKYKADLAVYLDSLPEDKRKEEMEVINAAALKRMNSRKKSKLKSRVKAKLLKRRSSSPNATDGDDPNKPKKVRSDSRKRVFRAGIRASMRNKNPVKSESEETKSESKDADDTNETNTENNTKEDSKENIREGQDDSTQPEEPEDKKSSETESAESEDEDKPKEEPESELMARFKGQPKKPPATGFALFCSTYKGHQKRRDAWKRLGQIRRDRYELQLQILKREYIAEYAAFLKSLTKEELHEFAKLNLQQKKDDEEK